MRGAVSDRSEPLSPYSRPEAAKRRLWPYAVAALVAVAIVVGAAVLGYQILIGSKRNDGGPIIVIPSRDGSLPGGGMHSPRISNLKVLSGQGDSERDIVFTVYDEDGDIARDGGEQPELPLTLVCGQVELTLSWSATRVEMKDANNGQVYTSLVKGLPGIDEESCEMYVSIKDQAGNESNQLKTRIEFK